MYILHYTIDSTPPPRSVPFRIRKSERRTCVLYAYRSSATGTGGGGLVVLYYWYTTIHCHDGNYHDCDCNYHDRNQENKPDPAPTPVLGMVIHRYSILVRIDPDVYTYIYSTYCVGTVCVLCTRSGLISGWHVTHPPASERAPNSHTLPDR